MQFQNLPSLICLHMGNRAAMGEKKILLGEPLMSCIKYECAPGVGGPGTLARCWVPAEPLSFSPFPH